jgi:HSP20 family protein
MSRGLMRRSGVRGLMPWGSRGPRWFDDLRREMDDVFNQFLGTEGLGELDVYAPRMNVAETDKQYEVTLDMPGMKAEEFNVEFRDGSLCISGERRHEAEEEGKTYHRIERAFGRFQRIIPLGANVEADKVEAEYKEGVLRVIVPKAEAAQPKKITVKS